MTLIIGNNQMVDEDGEMMGDEQEMDERDKVESGGYSKVRKEA